eukprot:TRINITY_DN51969_c0_g1_i1.p1 TRINITY_DN51969_c0_g1~~TRINITY_DN51969_c0_g1_i1.p1  ORF type:complete len:355 (+),score=121.04 TRINITY_DN51969_c0_g1_i1:71-1066(+)
MGPPPSKGGKGGKGGGGAKGAAPAAKGGKGGGAKGGKGKGKPAGPPAAPDAPPSPAGSRSSTPAAAAAAAPDPDLQQKAAEMQKQVEALKEEVAQLRSMSPLRRQREMQDPMLSLFIEKLRRVYDRAADEAGPAGVTRELLIAAMERDPDVRWHHALAKSPSSPPPAALEPRLSEPHGGAALYGRLLRALDLSESGIDQPALRAVRASRLTFADLCEIVGGAWEPPSGGACGAAEERVASLYDAALAAHRRQHGPSAVLPRGAVASALRADSRVRAATTEGIGYCKLLVLLEQSDPGAPIDWRELRELFPSAFDSAALGPVAGALLDGPPS